MKKITLLLVALYFTNLHAQLPTVQQYKTQQSSALQSSLATLTASGAYATHFEMLYERVTPFAGLYTYNDAENNIAKASLFKQALSELHRTSNYLKFESSESLDNRLRLSLNAQLNYGAVVKIGVINTPISYLNYNPEFPNDGGAKLVNGVYVAANNLPPFLQTQVTMMSPLEELVLTKDNKITYQFASSEFYQWGNKKIASMTVDFGNGVLSTVFQNQIRILNSIDITYTTVDENKKLTFNIVYTDGTTLTTYAGISVGKDTTATNPLARGTSGLSTFISTIADPNGAIGRLEYRIFYGDQNSNNAIKKPFIIVDGFDPGDKRKIIANDCANDPNCIKANKDWGTKTYESIEYLMQYGDKKDLKTQLTALNYDVVIVNFQTYKNNLGQVVDGGADDIFRNGRTVASFLQKINTDIKRNGSTAKLVVVGPSMGGQITRYALAYMEKKQTEAILQADKDKWNHNTRIYLSMDSPHQGASIPLAIQGDLYFLGELMGQDDAKDKYRNVINSKAARQMLLTNLAGQSPSYVNNEHISYKQELVSSGITGSNGYPVLNGIRKLAIANGSMTGVFNVSPATKFYEVVGLAKLRSSLTFGIRIAKVPAFRINNWFMSNTGTSLDLVQNYSKLIQPPAYNFNHSNSLWQGSLDAVPGGSFNAANDLKNEVYTGLQDTNAFTSVFGFAFPALWTGEKLIIEQRIPNNIDIVIAPQSFIPTHSALDTSGFSDWYQPVNENLVCSGQTPFNSFYGENTNMPHITFTDNMVKWLIKELGTNTTLPVPQAPSFPIDQNALSGSSTICLNSNTTYSFADVCKVPSAATWSVTPNLQIISFSGFSVIVKGLTTGSGTITATFQNGQTIIKTVWVGLPAVPQLVTYSNIPFDSTLMNGPYWNPVWQFKTTNPNDLVEEFIFKDLSDNVIISKYPNGGTVEISASELGLGYGATLSFYVYTRNACGTINPIKKNIIKSTIYYPTLCQYGIGQGCGVQRIANPTPTSYYKIFPNPSSNIINISLFDETITPSPQTLITAVLYDLKGQEKRSVTVVNNTASINVSNLKSGIYVLKIIVDGVTESHQVVVE